MSKYFKFLVLALLLVGLMAGTAVAGTLKGPGATTLSTYTVAKEAVEAGTTSTPLDITLGTFDSKVAGIEYTPTDIPLGTLSDPLFNYTVSAGKWTISDGYICQGSSTIARYKTGTGTTTIQFDKSGATGCTDCTGSVSNNLVYKLLSNCNSGASPVVNLTVPPGTSSTDLTTKVGIATTQTIYDTGTAQLVEVKNQYSATVSTKANAQIDYEQAFKKLYDNSLSTLIDLVTVTIAYATLDYTVNDATTADNETATITLKSADISGINSVDIDTAFGTSYGTACTKDTTNKKFTCTYTAADIVADKTATLEINVDGTTVLGERDFTVDAELDFGDAAAKDRTIANSYALLQDSDAGGWDYRGTAVYVPLIKTSGDGTVETYIKLHSKDSSTSANQVRGIVLLSNGSTTVVSLGTITAGTPMLITGTNISDAVVAAGGTVDGSAGFAAVLSITTDKANLFGLATLVDSSSGTAQWRRIPLNVSSGSGLD